jgi:hypothetical protein
VLASFTAAASLRLQPINLLGGFDLGQVGLCRFVRFSGERMEGGLRGAGNLLVARNPVIRILDAVQIPVGNLSDFICSGCGASGELADQWSSGTPIRHLDNQRRARYTEGGVSVNFNFKVKK